MKYSDDIQHMYAKEPSFLPLLKMKKKRGMFFDLCESEKLHVKA